MAAAGGESKRPIAKATARGQGLRVAMAAPSKRRALEAVLLQQRDEVDRGAHQRHRWAGNDASRSSIYLAHGEASS